MKGAQNGVHAGHVANHLIGHRATQILTLIRAWGQKFVKLANSIGQGVNFLEPISQGGQQIVRFLDRVMFGVLVVHGLFQALQLSLNFGFNVVGSIFDSVSLFEIFLGALRIIKGNINFAEVHEDFGIRLLTVF